jgi:ABC-2 type transport system permease protein
MTPFSATLRSEWCKLVSLRSTKLLVVLGVVLGIGLSALLAWAMGASYDHWDASGRADFEPIGASMIGGVLSAVLFLVLGVKAATAEYGAGMMRLTLTATPRRWRVLAAKGVVLSAITLAAGLVLSVGMFLAAQAVFAAYGMPSAGLTDGDALRVIVAGTVLSPQFPLIALALGFVLRSTAASVIAVFAVIFGPPFLGGLLPAWAQDHVLAYLPGAAADAVSVGHLAGAPDGVSPAVGVLVVVAWLASFLAAAGAALERRDA